MNIYEFKYTIAELPGSVYVYQVYADSLPKAIEKLKNEQPIVYATIFEVAKV